MVDTTGYLRHQITLPGKAIALEDFDSLLTRMVQEQEQRVPATACKTSINTDSALHPIIHIAVLATGKPEYLERVERFVLGILRQRTKCW